MTDNPNMTSPGLFFEHKTEVARQNHRNHSTSCPQPDANSPGLGPLLTPVLWRCTAVRLQRGGWAKLCQTRPEAEARASGFSRCQLLSSPHFPLPLQLPFDSTVSHFCKANVRLRLRPAQPRNSRQRSIDHCCFLFVLTFSLPSISSTGLSSGPLDPNPAFPSLALFPSHRSPCLNS